jgi:hypothetical protein
MTTADRRGPARWLLRPLVAGRTGRGSDVRFVYAQCKCCDRTQTPTFSHLSVHRPNQRNCDIRQSDQLPSNGWTEGTDGSAATLYFMGDGRGNNAGKIYVPTGGPFLQGSP